jgi:hypothetical protein
VRSRQCHVVGSHFDRRIGKHHNLCRVLAGKSPQNLRTAVCISPIMEMSIKMNRLLEHGVPEVWGRNEKDFRGDRTSARKMYAMRECMLKHDIG